MPTTRQASDYLNNGASDTDPVFDTVTLTGVLSTSAGGSAAAAAISLRSAGYGIYSPGGGELALTNNTAAVLYFFGSGVVGFRSDQVIGFASTANAASGVYDTAYSRISAGLFGFGTGAAGSFAGSIKLTDLFTNNAAALIKTNTTLNDGAGAGGGTLTNAPTAGNPTKWIPIDDNGTTRYLPSWT